VAVDDFYGPAEGAPFLIERLVAANVAGASADLKRVVINDGSEIVEVVVPGGHRGFPVRTFGQFAVTEQREDAIRRGVHFSGDRHAGGNRQTVTERAGVHLDAGDMPRRMADVMRFVVAN